MRQDYPKICQAGAELVVVSPDSPEQHRAYGLDRYGEELPYLFVSDSTWEIGRRYGVLRAEEHPHGGFWNRSLWIINREGVIAHRLNPWEVSTQNAEITERQIQQYRRLFDFIGAERGELIGFCRGVEPASSAHHDGGS